jgi:hypothetical protein
MKKAHVKPDAKTYNAAVLVCAEAAQVDDGLKLVAEMALFGYSLDDDSRSSIMEAAGTVGKIAEVDLLYQAAIEQHMEPLWNQFRQSGSLDIRTHRAHSAKAAVRLALLSTEAQLSSIIIGAGGTPVNGGADPQLLLVAVQEELAGQKPSIKSSLHPSNPTMLLLNSDDVVALVDTPFPIHHSFPSPSFSIVAIFIAPC